MLHRANLGACAAAAAFAASSSFGHQVPLCAANSSLPTTTVDRIADIERRIAILQTSRGQKAGPFTVKPLTNSLAATWEVPGSKSITNRALILAALRPGTTQLSGVLHSDDTRHMRNALVACGIEIEDTGPTSLTVNGGLHRLKTPMQPIFIGNSGTSVRFLAAFAALVPGEVTLVGDEHMAKRPIADLVSALEQMGVEVHCPTGCPPITIKGGDKGLPGGSVTMRGTKSSQYFSALMLSGAFAKQPIKIQIEGTLVSLPYVVMTQKMVKGLTGGEISIDVDRSNTITIQPIRRSNDGGSGSDELHYVIEPDASSASYPFATAAATGSSITVPNLTALSIQGDYGFVEVLKQLGCTVEMGADYTKVTGPPRGELGAQPLCVDMHHISDTVMSLAAIAPLCCKPVEIRNVANIRIKETDRLVATVNELRRLGQQVEHGDDWLRITPGPPVKPASIECYADHRMAMAFGVLGLAVPGVTITDPSCTKKTYPGFWVDVQDVRGGE